MTMRFQPGRGDIVLFQDPSGAIDSPETMALVLSPKSYNVKTGVFLCCPINKKQLGYPFEVFDDTFPGVILADQIRTVQWHPENLMPIGQVSNKTLGEVGELITLLVGK